METFFQIIEIIVGVLNKFPEHNPTKLTYEYLAASCNSWDSTKECYIFELNENTLENLYTPWGKQPLHISQQEDNFMTNQILSRFSYIPIAKDTLLITHIDSRPIYYPTKLTQPKEYFIPYSKIDHIATKQIINNEIQRLISSHHLTDDFGALDQLVSTPNDYYSIIDIIGSQNTVSSCKIKKKEYMRPSTFIYLHLFGLIIMSQSNIYLRF